MLLPRQNDWGTESQDASDRSILVCPQKDCDGVLITATVWLGQRVEQGITHSGLGLHYPWRNKSIVWRVFLVPDLLLDMQVTTVTRNALHHLPLVSSQLQPFPGRRSGHSGAPLLTYRLNNWTAVCMGLHLKSDWDFNSCRMQQPRWWLEWAPRNHITPIVVHLQCLLVCFWARFKVLVFTFNVLYGLGPTYLKDCQFP